MKVDGSKSDAGETLAELLITIVIMGICFAAVLAGIGTTVRTSDINRQQAFQTSYLRGLAERIEAQPFAPCASTYSTSGVLPASSPYSASVSSVESLDPVSNSPVTPCVPPNDRLQRITVSIQPPDARAEAPQPLVILKRKP